VSFLPAALQLEIDRDPAEEIEPAAHSGDQEIVARGKLINNWEVEVHAHLAAQEGKEQRRRPD
jgi:hypothetical protein